MNSSQRKLGSFCENSKAASLALSIKGAVGLSERVGPEPAEGDASGEGSGQGGKAGCGPRFRIGRPLAQAGVSGVCDCVWGAEDDWLGCDCGEDPLCAFRETAALRKSTRTNSWQLNFWPE